MSGLYVVSSFVAAVAAALGMTAGVLGLLSAGGLILAAALATRPGASDWARRRVQVGERGEGAYRSVPSFVDVAIPPPRSVRVAAALARAWGAVEAIVVAPAAGVIAMTLVVASDVPVGGVFLLVAAALALSALGLGFGLVVAARMVALGVERSGTREVVVWSVWHHLALSAACIAGAIVGGAAVGPLASAGVLHGALGLAITTALHRAREDAFAARVDVGDTR